MDEPELVTETGIETDERGARRFVEESTRPDPARGGRSAYLRIRRSRPIRDGETAQLAAADSLAFADDAALDCTRACGGEQDGDRFTRLFNIFKDGSFFYQSEWYTREYLEGKTRQLFGCPPPRP